MRLPFLFNPKAVAADWDITNGTGYYRDYGTDDTKFQRWIKLSHKTEKVQVVVNYNLRKKVNKWDDSFSGSTFFTDADGHQCSFDLTGVEDSFYITRKGCKKEWGPATLEEAAVEQLKRVRERLDRIKAAGGFISVPDIGFRVTKAGLEEKKATLKAGKSISFTPGGFGTGYHISPKGRQSYGTKLASVALCNFFDMPLLYISEMDCD